MSFVHHPFKRSESEEVKDHHCTQGRKGFKSVWCVRGKKKEIKKHTIKGQQPEPGFHQWQKKKARKGSNVVHV